jgi:hypothetical protein
MLEFYGMLARFWLLIRLRAESIRFEGIPKVTVFESLSRKLPFAEGSRQAPNQLPFVEEKRPDLVIRQQP